MEEKVLRVSCEKIRRVDFLIAFVVLSVLGLITSTIVAEPGVVIAMVRSKSSTPSAFFDLWLLSWLSSKPSNCFCSEVIAPLSPCAMFVTLCDCD